MSGYYCQPRDVYHGNNEYNADYNETPINIYKHYNNTQEEITTDCDQNYYYPCNTQTRVLKTWYYDDADVENQQSMTEKEFPRFDKTSSCQNVQSNFKTIFRNKAAAAARSSMVTQTPKVSCISTATLTSTRSEIFKKSRERMFGRKKIEVSTSSCCLSVEKSCNTLLDYDCRSSLLDRNGSHKQDKETLIEYTLEPTIKKCKPKNPRNDGYVFEPIATDTETPPVSDVCVVNSIESTISKSTNFITDGVANFITNFLASPVVEDIKQNVFGKTSDNHVTTPLKKKQSCLEYPPKFENTCSSKTKIIWNGHRNHKDPTTVRNTRKRRRRSDVGAMHIWYQLMLFLIFLIGMYLLNSLVQKM